MLEGTGTFCDREIDTILGGAVTGVGTLHDRSGRPVTRRFPGATYVVPDCDGGWAWVSGALAALSVFGFTRLVHRVLVSDPWWRFYYSKHDHEQVLCAWRPDYGHVAERGLRNPNDWRNHLVPGVVYLIVFVVLAGAAHALAC